MEKLTIVDSILGQQHLTHYISVFVISDLCWKWLYRVHCMRVQMYYYLCSGFKESVKGKNRFETSQSELRVFFLCGTFLKPCLSVRRLDDRSVGWSVCHNFLSEHFLSIRKSCTNENRSEIN